MRWTYLENRMLGSVLAIAALFLIAWQHSLQIRVVSFWFGAAGEAHFFQFAGRGDVDSL